MADPGIDAVEPIACRDLEVSLDRARLAAQPEEPVVAAAGAGYLIHDPARRADHVVLHLLAGRGQVGLRHVICQARGHSRSRRDFECRRRGDSSPFGHGRVDEQSQARGPASPLSNGALQAQLHDAHDVTGPAVGLASREPGRQCRRCAERPIPLHERREVSAEELPPSRAAGRQVATRRGLALQQRRGRALERQLEDAGSAVVGDSAHDVESPRRAGDVEG